MAASLTGVSAGREFEYDFLTWLFRVAAGLLGIRQAFGPGSGVQISDCKILF